MWRNVWYSGQWRDNAARGLPCFYCIMCRMSLRTVQFLLTHVPADRHWAILVIISCFWASVMHYLICFSVSLSRIHVHTRSFFSCFTWTFDIIKRDSRTPQWKLYQPKEVEIFVSNTSIASIFTVSWAALNKKNDIQRVIEEWSTKPKTRQLSHKIWLTVNNMSTWID